MQGEEEEGKKEEEGKTARKFRYQLFLTSTCTTEMSEKEKRCVNRALRHLRDICFPIS
jgi:hypothetical protein